MSAPTAAARSSPASVRTRKVILGRRTERLLLLLDERPDGGPHMGLLGLSDRPDVEGDLELLSIRFPHDRLRPGPFLDPELELALRRTTEGPGRRRPWPSSKLDQRADQADVRYARLMAGLAVIVTLGQMLGPILLRALGVPT